MNNFKEDVKLLADLQGMIERAEKQANPPEFADTIFGAISPVLKAAMPAAQQEARRQVDILTRAKARLETLIEEAENK